MKIIVTLLCCAPITLAITLLCAPAGAAPLPAAGTFQYYTSCANGEDVIYFRVALTRSKDALSATIDFNDGNRPGQAQAQGIKFDAATGALSFSFKGDLSHTFSGKITREAVTGSFDAAPPLTLPLLTKAKTENVFETLHPCVAQ